MAMPALGATLSLFDKSVLMDFLLSMSTATFSDVDWDSDDMIPKLVEKINGLNKGSRTLHNKIFCQLHDIWFVAEKRNDYKYYMTNVVKKSDSLHALFWKRFKRSPTLHTFSMWLCLADKDAFDRLLRRRFANSKNAMGGSTYFLPSNISGEISEDYDSLASEIKAYFGKLDGVTHQVNVERNVIGDFVRFVVAMNSMPKEEPAFAEDATEPYNEDADGGFGAPPHSGNDALTKASVKTPDFMYITYYEKTPRKASGTFTVKADNLTKDGRDQVARIFAETILSTHIVDKNEIRHNLAAFKKRPKDFDFAEAEPDWIATHYRGIYMTLTPTAAIDKKLKPEIYHREVNGNIYDALDNSSELNKVQSNLINVEKLMLEVEIISGERLEKPQMLLAGGIEDTRQAKTYKITVPASGEWTVSPKPTLVDEAKLVRIIETMNIFNRRGEQILYRK